MYPSKEIQEVYKMKHYEIMYWLHNQSRLFGKPQVVIAKTRAEKDDIIAKCERNGYVIEMVQPFDPVPVEERFYA